MKDFFIKLFMSINAFFLRLLRRGNEHSLQMS